MTQVRINAANYLLRIWPWQIFSSLDILNKKEHLFSCIAIMGGNILRQVYIPF